MANPHNTMNQKLSAPLQHQHLRAPWDAERNTKSLPSEIGGKALLSIGSERGSIFLTSDDNALAKQIEQLHRPDARYVNVRPLFQLVEEIIHRASQTIEGPSGGHREADRKISLSGLEEVPDLPLIVERISSEMTYKLLSGIDAHNTTLSVLNMLPQFSWEAKVVLTLAAFALTFGDFWLLAQMYSTNALAKSMAMVKRLPMVMEHAGAFRNQFETINNLIRTMLETTHCMVEFGELPTVHISDQDHEVKAAMSHFPIAVYWIIRSAVAAATQITTMSSRDAENMSATAESWELSNWNHKLKTISDHLRNMLKSLYRLIEEKKQIDSYNMIKKIIYHTKHVDNMKVLKTLIYADDDMLPLYDGVAKRKVHLDVLRSRNVLLLVSGLDITHEELSILEESYNESKVHAYEIVWIPVVDRSVPWKDSMEAQLENLKTSMTWYSVHHPKVIGDAVIKFLRDDWHFSGKPILVVLDPHGKVLSPNAIHMMWIWQSQAFPFTSIREEALWEQETWRLELLVNSIDPKVLEWIRDEKYIFLYGGDDLEWIRKFTNEARIVARALQVPLEMLYVGRSHNKELVRKNCAALTVEQLSHCWQDPTYVWYFWARIESMIYSKFQLGKVDDHGDIILQEIQRLHSHDKSHAGWAVLAKGSTIVVHGQGKLALLALQEMDAWKERALNEGFEVGYGSHYKELHMREYPCHRIEFPASVRIPQNMLCPECRRHMHRYNSFICCHDDPTAAEEISPAAATAANAAQYE